MKALSFWKAVTADRSDFLERVVDLLRETGIRYCAVGDLAVNAYAEPVVTLDFDIAVALEDLSRAESLLNFAAAGSDLRVQLQKDSRYSSFVGRSQARNILGLTLPVAAIDDVLRGKVWTAQDPARRSSKRLKDLADIARLLETAPQLRDLVPPDILKRLF